MLKKISAALLSLAIILPAQSRAAAITLSEVVISDKAVDSLQYYNASIKRFSPVTYSAGISLVNGVLTVSGGGGTWGSITGTLSNQTDLQTALNAKVTANGAITGATKTKITYDAKGLVTAGADATTSDIAEGSNLYFTNERVDDRVASLLVGGTDIGLSYNDVANTLTISYTGTSGGTPGGADTSFQWNNAGSFAGTDIEAFFTDGTNVYASGEFFHYFKAANASTANFRFDLSLLSDLRAITVQDASGTMALWGNGLSNFDNDLGFLAEGDLASARIFVGNASNVAVSRAMSGDATLSNTGVLTIANDAVTFAKMQNITTDRLIGRDTASTGDPEEIAVSGGIEFTGSAGIRTSAFTGDVTKTAGGTALTLATVNSNVGSFGSSTSIPSFTVNAKGLITAASGNVVIAPAGTLTGTTLASNVVTSSLTTVGTLAAGNATAIVDAASTSTAGKVELATTAETNTGTDTVRAVTPDGLAGSYAGTKPLGLLLFASASNVTTGDKRACVRVPQSYNGMNLVSVGADVSTTSSSGTPTVQISRGRQSSPTSAPSFVDMLSTAITIDASEYDSIDATTPAVINSSNDDVLHGDVICADVDVAGTGTKGLMVNMEFRLP